MRSFAAAVDNNLSTMSFFDFLSVPVNMICPSESVRISARCNLFSHS